MYVVGIRTKIFRPGSQSFSEENTYFTTEDREKAKLYAQYKSLNPMVTRAYVAEVIHEYEDGTDIYGRDKTASS